MDSPTLPFDRNADRWHQYTGTLKGRIRRALILGQLQAHLAALNAPIRVLDAGCGIGDIACCLLPQSRHIVLLDFSAQMLAEAGRRLRARYSAQDLARVTLRQAQVEHVTSELADSVFDLILCHGVLEYVADPRAIMAALADRLAPDGLLSLVAANRYSKVLKDALVDFDWRAALESLENSRTRAALFDGVSKRTFYLSDLEQMVQALGFAIVGRYGIRIFTDFMPETAANKAENEPMLLKLEMAACALAPCLEMANSFHLICRKRPAEPVKPPVLFSAGPSA